MDEQSSRIELQQVSANIPCIVMKIQVF